MKLKISKLISLTLALVIAFSLSACAYAGYKGEYVEFYTQAVNAIPYVRGFVFDFDYTKDADIRVMEKDEYGRTLVYYCEHIEYEEEFFNYQIFLFVNQKSDQTYTYYYPNNSYGLYRVKIENNGDRYDHYGIGYEPEEYINGLLQKIEKKYSSEISNLKTANDWGKPIEEIKCIKIEISNKCPKFKLKIFDLF